MGNISNWWLHFAVKLGLTNKDPLIFRAKNYVDVEVPRRLLHEFKEIFMEECYTRGLGLPVPENPTVIDIGANAGFFSLFAASRFPGSRIFSYEPVSVNYQQLLRNRSLNQSARIMCFQKAVYSYSGEISICFDPGDSFTTAAHVAEKAEDRDEKARVPCVTLKEIFDEHRLSRCDLLKMDSEGSEYDIIYSCPDEYLCRVDQMAIEVHKGTEVRESMESLVDWLGSRTFTTHCSGHMLWAWKQE